MQKVGVKGMPEGNSKRPKKGTPAECTLPIRSRSSLTSNGDRNYTTVGGLGTELNYQSCPEKRRQKKSVEIVWGQANSAEEGGNTHEKVGVV